MLFYFSRVRKQEREFLLRETVFCLTNFNEFDKVGLDISPLNAKKTDRM